jgi:hypothetical protein
MDGAFQKFMRDLLHAGGTFCIDQMYQEGRNLSRLIRKTKNEQFNFDQLECTDCNTTVERKKPQKRLFKQCKSCAVTVLQRRVGFGLQFLWKSDDSQKIYSSRFGAHLSDPWFAHTLMGLIHLPNLLVKVLIDN